MLYSKFINIQILAYAFARGSNNNAIAIRVESNSKQPNSVSAKSVFEYKMPSGPMEDTINIGDKIVIDKNVSDFVQTDIIAYKYREDPSKMFIDRIIGMPGDTIKIVNKKVYINEVEVIISREVHKEREIIPASMNQRDNSGPLTLHEGEYFVLG
jgi:signal peptidase I